LGGGLAGRCPHCGGAAHQTERYPDALCADCARRATDLAGRPVRMYNESFSGGFLAQHADDGSACDQVTADGRVLIEGTEFRAGEAHMGGIVVRALRGRGLGRRGGHRPGLLVSETT
jgi:hypothetical protein